LASGHTEVAIALGTNSEIDATGSTILGPISPLHARILGLTELPIDRVTKDAHAVAPLEYQARAREMVRFEPSATLRSIAVVYGDTRGLVDLDAADYKGMVDYAFELPVHEAIPEAPPVRPGLPTPPRPNPTLRIVKRVRLDANGMRVEEGGADTSAAPLQHPVAPRCSMAQLWAAALHAGAPSTAVARISFDAAAPGLWHFVVNGSNAVPAVTIDVSNETCQRVLLPGNRADVF